MARSVLALTLAFVASTMGLMGFVLGGGGRVSSAKIVTGVSPPSFADIVDRLNAAVVHIDVVEGSARGGRLSLDRLGSDVPRRGEGSGFVVDASGYVLTNHHLVASPTRIRVRLADKREMAATLIGTDPNTDLALLKVEAEGLATVPLGDSDRLRVGEWVCAIGNPYSFDHTVTVGVVSSKGRKIFNASFDSYIQTDAAINPGNSGGPLINSAGEAVGINAAVSTEGQGIGFAIPINAAREIIGQLREHGHVSRGYLGVQLHELDPDLQRLVGLGTSKGAVVVDVIKGQAGEAAGLRRYDVITGVSGQPIEDGDQLVRAIAARKPGTSTKLTIFRDGRSLVVDARLKERGVESPETASNPPGETSAEGGDCLGLIVRELGQKMRTDLSIPPDKVGVVIKDVVGLSNGADILAHGDLVVEVNRRPTPDLAAYKSATSLLRRGDVAWLFIYRPRPESSLLTKVEVEGQ